MYLKRLDLQGFKSFASTLRLEFGPGVTCIIGPNGSGKTNVAEAIRWVFGEQASRIIRARKTEDVIFSGSARRPQLGMAEVRISLYNGDGWLPLDYEEVVVSRRANRSGENEYLINQDRVRLRDLTELFLKAQVGQNSYAFMGQGLVEEVLTLRPEERRTLIEEAADVKLHRTKLDESRNRLRATRDNLERVSMLVAEIEPRLRQLERQADRAATHARISAELSQALQAWYGEQWQEAQEAQAAARAAYDQHREEFEASRRSVQACEEGAEAITAAIADRRRGIVAQEEASRSLDEYVRDLQRRITLDAERRDMLTVRRQEVLSEREALRRERGELAEARERQDVRARELDSEISAIRPPEDEARELERIEGRLGELRPALAERERSAAEARSRLAETEVKANALTQQRDRARNSAASMEAARPEQLAGLKSWARDFAVRHQRLSQLEPAADNAAGALAQAATQVDNFAGALARRERAARELGIEGDSVRARLEAVQATDVELPAPDAGARALLAAGGRLPGEEPPPESRILGMVGIVGEFLRVPAGLERAIEAALADSLHAIVVESQEDALAAVELLVSEDLGRATVYPLPDVRSSSPLNLLEERGVIGVASQLVRCDARYRSLVDFLLGRTIVAENVGIGKMLLRRGLGDVVTLDGTLLHHAGAMTAGSAKAVRQALSHKREVGELPVRLERLLTEHREATTALETAQRFHDELSQARDEHDANAKRLRADVAEGREALRQQTERLHPRAARLYALRDRRRDTLRALAEAEEALKATAQEISRSRAQAQELESALEQCQGEIEEFTTARSALTDGNAEQSKRLATLEGEAEALRQLRDSQAATVERAERELAHRDELVERLEEELHTVQGRLELASREREEKKSESDAAREALAPAGNALGQMETRQGSIGDELAEARAQAIASERALLDSEAAVRLRTEEIENLRGRLEEEGFAPSDEGDIVPAADEDEVPAWLSSEKSEEGEALPPMQGGASADATDLKERISELRGEIRSLGPVNEQAQTDYAENRERYDFLSGQLTDLQEAEASLLEAIDELEAIMRERFSTTFKQVNQQFQSYFQTFFGGGEAELLLTKQDEHGLPGVDIIAQPPRKNVRTLNLLSGGERSLTALALLFALLHIHPSPICVLDEVDAALDEANVDRFTAALRELAERTQFIIITHNRRTIEMADTIYGVSMGADSVSSVLSLRLSDVQLE